MPQRLDKMLANAGVGTRSQVRMILRAGRVAVNGVAVRDGSVQVAPELDSIFVDGVQVAARERIVLMLNKPAGFISATEDSRDPTVMELIPKELCRRGLAPIGRLDKETEGLLLFTDDGALAHVLLSPKSQVSKRYYARHKGQATPADVQAFADGLVLQDGTQCLPARLEPMGPGESMITVWEGKYHQVRRMMAARGLQVLYLERQAEGAVTLDRLPRGQVRVLTQRECDALLRSED